MSINKIIDTAETLESYLVLVRTAIIGQSWAETGIIGNRTWETVFGDMCDRVYEIIEGLKAIEQNN